MRRIYVVLFVLLVSLHATPAHACSKMSPEAKELFQAIYRSDLPAVTRLADRVNLNRNYLIDKRTYEDICSRPLEAAIRTGQSTADPATRLEIVKVLLKEGASPRDLGFQVTEWKSDEDTLLDLLEALKQRGYSLKQDRAVGYPERKSLLAYYSEHADFPRVIELLARAGSKVNIPMRNGGTPLSYSAMRCENGEKSQNQVAVIQNLLKHGAVPTSASLWAAVTRGCSQQVVALIQGGASVPELDHSYYNFLSEFLDRALSSLANGHGTLDEVRTAFRLLVEKGLDINRVAPGTRDGAPIHVVAKYSRPELFEELLGLGAKIDLPGDDGKTALMTAVWYSEVPVSTIEKLLQLGASMDPYDRYGHSALHIACRSGQIAKAMTFLDAGADINRGVPLNSVFDMCGEKRLQDRVIPTLNALLARGADPKQGAFRAALENHCSAEVLRILQAAGG